MTLTETARSARSPYRNLGIILALLIPAALLGFANSYFKGLTFSGLTFSTLIHVHAAVMALWILMLIGQAWFIRVGDPRDARTAGGSLRFRPRWRTAARDPRAHPLRSAVNSALLRRTICGEYLPMR